MEEVRRRMVATAQALENKVKEIKLSVARDDGKKPREQALQRQLTGLIAAWKAYETVHLTYVMHAEDPEEIEVAGTQHQEHLHGYELAAEAAEDLIAKRQEDAQAVATNAAAQRGADAAAEEVVDAARQKEQEFSIAKASRDDVFRRVIGMVTTARAYLDRNSNQECRDSLEGEMRQLDGAERLLAETSAHTLTMVKCKPAEAEASLTAESTKRVEALDKIQECRAVLSERLGKVKLARPAAAPTVGGAQHFFKKRELPKFEGELRDFPAFRRDWHDSVAGKFDQGEEVRCIKERVPKEVEPDVKNLHTMVEIWKVLDDKYGNAMDLSRVLISGLWNLTLPASESEPSRFKILHREWLKVFNDLKQIGQLSALDHDPTLCQVAAKLPSEEAKKNYSRLRVKMRAANEKERSQPGSEVGKISELAIMSVFMEEERQLQDQYGQLCSPSGNAASRSSHSNVRGGDQSWAEASGGEEEDICPICRGAHNAYDCEFSEGMTLGDYSSTRSKGSANANMHLKPRACPACQEQHTIKGRDGKILYKNRLSVCEVFQELSVEERAELVEKVGVCALCLDWTGTHNYNTCTEQRSGGRGPFKPCARPSGNGELCGRKHHEMLHGASTRFCFVTRAKLVMNPRLTNSVAGRARASSMSTPEQVRPRRTWGKQVKDKVAATSKQVMSAARGLIIAKGSRRQGDAEVVTELPVEEQDDDEDVFEDALEELCNGVEADVVQVELATASFLEQALQVGGAKFQEEVGLMLAKVKQRESFLQKAVLVGGPKFKQEVETLLRKHTEKEEEKLVKTEEKIEAKVVEKQTEGIVVERPKPENSKSPKWPFSKLKSVRTSNSIKKGSGSEMEGGAGVNRAQVRDSGDRPGVPEQAGAGQRDRVGELRGGSSGRRGSTGDWRPSQARRMTGWTLQDTRAYWRELS